MEDTPSLQPLTYVHDGVSLTGQLALPKAEGLRPAVLVMHDALGLGSLTLRRTRQLAAEGFVALASDMYGVDMAAADADEHGRQFMALQSDPTRLRGRVLAGLEALRGVPGVDPDRICAIGFCFGGQCVLELARSGADVVSVVSFHGLLTTQLPAQAGAVKARMLVITGALDPHVPTESVRAFEQEMADADADWQLTTYGKGWHAFTDPEVGKRDDIPGVRYDPLLDRLSWAQAGEFLSATLALV